MVPAGELVGVVVAVLYDRCRIRISVWTDDLHENAHWTDLPLFMI